MRRILYTFLLIICLLNNSCRLLESAVSDINGWDISACVSGFDTCWEFYWDNVNKFSPGFEEAMEEL